MSDDITPFTDEIRGVALALVTNCPREWTRLRLRIEFDAQGAAKTAVQFMPADGGAEQRFNLREDALSARFAFEEIRRKLAEQGDASRGFEFSLAPDGTCTFKILR